MKDIETFLLKNGFKISSYNHFTNDKCEVYICGNEDSTQWYHVEFNGLHCYSDNLQIYWLIGMLTYNGLMTKKYKQNLK